MGKKRKTTTTTTIVSVTYENERSSIKKVTLLLMCVTSLLCGPRVDLWPFYELLCKRFPLCRAKTVLNSRENRFFSHTLEL